MHIHVKLSTSLRACVPGYNPATGLTVEIAAPMTAAGLARHLSLPLDEIKMIMRNGTHASFESPLSDGDRVAYFPPVGGG